MNMGKGLASMRIVKIILTFLILSALAVPVVSCADESDSALASENEIVTVQRGDVVIDITASGNLELSLKEDLAFEIVGTVEEVLVEEGDTVNEGQVVAKLDSTSLNQAVEAAEMTVKTRELDLRLAEKAIVTAEINLKSAIDNFDELKMPYSPYNALTFLSDMPEAESAIRDAQRQLEEAKEGLKAEPGSEQYLGAWDKFEQAMEKLTLAQETLSRSQGEEAFITYTEYARDYWKLHDAKLAIDKADLSLSDAKDRLEKASLTLESARNDLEIDRDKLEDTVITTPFSGFITKVNVEGGDEIFKGTVAAQLADPGKFEAEVMVGEMDILQVKLDGTASVQVDAIQGMSLPAKVTHIAPTATIQQGVVNYVVKVEVMSLQPVPQDQQGARQGAMQQIAEGELPPRLKQAVEEGRMTQEQAEQMRERLAQLTPEQMEEMRQQRQQGQGEQPAAPSMVPEDFQLREGLTVTVSILVDERRNALLIPNKAVIHQKAGTQVQVLKDGVIEERAIKTGISDWQNTEVIEGLSEGEQVVIPDTTTATSTSTQSKSGARIPLFMGGKR